MQVMGHFKSFFLRGLAVLLPTILTIWLFVWGYGFIQKNISVHINRGIVALMMSIQDLSDSGSKEALYGFWVDGPGSIAGFILALFVVCVIGAMLANVVGRSLWRMIEKFIMGVPLLKKVYPHVKQITDFIFTKDQLSFSRVVAFEYPRRGSWALGLVTSNGLKKLNEKTGKEHLTVFLPTSPTPFTGFIMMVPAEEVIELDITVEEAVRFTISGGVITPNMKVKDGQLEVSNAKEPAGLE